jgi:hypothetical protein
MLKSGSPIGAARQVIITVSMPLQRKTKGSDAVLFSLAVRMFVCSVQRLYYRNGRHDCSKQADQSLLRRVELRWGSGLRLVFVKNPSSQLEAELLASRSRTLTIELWESNFGPVLMLRSGCDRERFSCCEPGS